MAARMMMTKIIGFLFDVLMMTGDECALVAENFDSFLDDNVDQDDQAKTHDDNTRIMIFQADTDKNNNNAKEENKM